MSRMLAAQTTVDIAAGRQDEREAAEAYGRWFVDRSRHDVARLYPGPSAPRRGVMSHYGCMRRSTALYACAVLMLPACSEVQQAREVASTAGKVADCAALATDAARAGLEQVGQLDAQSAQDAADRVGERVNQISDADVRAAAERLRDALSAAAEAARTGDVPALEAARQEVTDSAKGAAQTCGLPEDQFATG